MRRRLNYCPADAAPGRYEGKLAVSAGPARFDEDARAPDHLREDEEVRGRDERHQHGDDHQAPIVGEALQLPVYVLAAHHVEHHVDPAALCRVPDHGHEVLAPILDGPFVHP